MELVVETMEGPDESRGELDAGLWGKGVDNIGREAKEITYHELVKRIIQELKETIISNGAPDEFHRLFWLKRSFGGGSGRARQRKLRYDGCELAPHSCENDFVGINLGS